MKFLLVVIFLIASCGNSPVSKLTQAKEESVSSNQPATVEMLEVSDFVVYSQVLETIAYGNSGKEVFQSVSGADWLTIRKDTIAPKNLESIKSPPNVSSELVKNFVENNRSKGILENGFDVKIAHDVVGEKGSIEAVFASQKRKNARLKAVIGLSKIGFNSDKSQSLVLVEYCNPEIGIQEKYCLINWKKSGVGLKHEDIVWF